MTEAIFSYHRQTPKPVRESLVVIEKLLHEKIIVFCLACYSYYSKLGNYVRDVLTKSVRLNLVKKLLILILSSCRAFNLEYKFIYLYRTIGKEITIYLNKYTLCKNI